jgi:hypothetical protein
MCPGEESHRHGYCYRVSTVTRTAFEQTGPKLFLSVTGISFIFAPSDQRRKIVKIF